MRTRARPLFEKRGVYIYIYIYETWKSIVDEREKDEERWNERKEKRKGERERESWNGRCSGWLGA